MSRKTNQEPQEGQPQAEAPEALEQALTPGQPKAQKWTPGKGEENDIHVIIEQPYHDSITGEQLSKPRRQSFNLIAWKDFQEFGPRMGFWVREVLHVPKGVNADYKNPDPSIQKAKRKDELMAELRSLQQKIEALD